MLALIKLGGPLMWPLIVCSIIALSVILDRFFYWLSRALISSSSDRGSVELALQSGNRDLVQTLLDKSSDPLLGVIGGVLKKPLTLMEPSFDKLAEIQLYQINRYHRMLNLIVAIAPILGILGTVIGIILTFNLMGAGVQNPEEITSGIGQALITTATGLGIAIITMLAEHVFAVLVKKEQMQLQRLYADLEAFTRLNK